jgi:hypothetical protein
MFVDLQDILVLLTVADFVGLDVVLQLVLLFVTAIVVRVGVFVRKAAQQVCIGAIQVTHTYVVLLQETIVSLVAGTSK